MAVLLGVLVGGCFGTGDFVGGLASRRAPATTVLAYSQVTALVLGGAGAAAFGGAPTPRDLGLGAAAGALVAVGLGLLYRGLASGRMGIVAPLAAVTGALVPVAWGLATGERPSTVAFAGVALAIVAGGLIGRERDAATGGTATSVGLALAAGVLLGSSFVCYAATGDDSGFWPIVSSRVVGVLLVAGVVLARGTFRAPPHTRRSAALAGTLDVGGQLLLLIAVRRELTVLVAPLAGLAPAFTVGWAWIALREPVSRVQAVGLGLAVVSLGCIAAG